MEILSHAREILVHLRDIRPLWARGVSRDQRIRETLKIINFQRCRSEPVTKENWDPCVVSRLFAQNTVVMVDVRDPGEVERMTAIRSAENLTTQFGPPFSHFIESWQEEEQFFRKSKDDKRSRHSMAWAENVFNSSMAAKRCRITTNAEF